MLGDKPKCATCAKEIQGDDMVYVKMRYPRKKGVTEMKAYLNSHETFICEDCFNKKSDANQE